MKQLLITRHQSRSREIADLLQKENFSVFCEPLFSVKKISNQISLSQISAVILTSANAIPALIEAGIKKDVKIFTVGKITAEKLRKKGFKNLIISVTNSAKSLVVEIAASKPERSLPMLYFHGSIITLDFATELKNFGIEVKKILAYETKEKKSFSKEAKSFFKKNR
jgi:uroporphyrinogen-III synthase